MKLATLKDGSRDGRLGLHLEGTDAWSWDAPFSHTRARFAGSGDASIIWEGHKAGRDIGYGQMEKMSNLECLPAHGFEVSCFPYKIKHATAGFVRAVAIFFNTANAG